MHLCDKEVSPSHDTGQPTMALLGALGKTIQMNPAMACQVVSDIENPVFLDVGESPMTLVFGMHPTMGYCLAIHSAVGNSVALVQRVGPLPT